MHEDPTPLLEIPARLDPRLGRLRQLDTRSLSYMIERTPAELRRPIRSVRWRSTLPILDQKNLGACVGYASTRLLATGPFNVLGGLIGVDAYTDPSTAEKASGYAEALYGECTLSDPFEGSWPPDDTGTDGLTACKVLKRRGVITAYRHASTLRGLAELLQDGPVLMGMPWFGRFFEPDPGSGRIDPVGWADTENAGGHEVVIEGVLLDAHRPTELDRAVFTCPNSWSPSWGKGGYFTVGGRTLELLRHQIDWRQPLVGH